MTRHPNRQRSSAAASVRESPIAAAGARDQSINAGRAGESSITAPGARAGQIPGSISIAIIVSVALALLTPLWLDHGIVYSKHSDIIGEHVAVKAVGVRAWSVEGRCPLWNPSMNSGAPALANPQSMYVFPLDLLYLVLPLERATNLVLLSNVMLAGMGMYWFGRRFFRHASVALFTALAYMLSFRYLAMIYSGWLPKMSMYALVPLLFGACAGLFERVTWRRSVWLAVVVALCGLQGDMQQLYYAVLGCGVYLLVRLIRTAAPSRWRVAVALAAGGFGGVMLAMPVLLPRFEFARLSTRVTSSYDFFLGRAPQPAEWATFVHPDTRGAGRSEFWENNFYFGLWLLPFWGLAFARVRAARPASGARARHDGSRDGLDTPSDAGCGSSVRVGRRAVLLLLAAAIGTFLCFDTAVLRFLFEYLPGFALFRQSTRLLLLVQFAVVLLAGLGFDVLLESRQSPLRRGVFAFSVVATALGGASVTLRTGGGSLFLLAGLVVLLLLGLAVVYPRTPRWGLVALACLLPVADAAVQIRPDIRTVPLDSALPRHGLHALLQRAPNEGRVLAIGRETIPYGSAGYYGIDLVNGYASLNLQHYVEYFSLMQFGSVEPMRGRPVVWTDCLGLTRADLLHALDVRYVVANAAVPLESFGYEQVAAYSDVPVFLLYHGVETRPVIVWRLKAPLGPAYFASAVDAVGTDGQSRRALTAATDARVAIVRGFERGAQGLDFAGGVATQMQRGFNRYTYDVDSRGYNYLILSQIWYPGWRARLNGAPLPLYRTNHALLGCCVPPGRHTLTLEMTSPPMRIGLICAGAAIAASMVVRAWTWRSACLASRAADGGAGYTPPKVS